MSRVVGIDLGTTNSLVAYVKDGRPEIIRDKNGDGLVPSVVTAAADGTMYVGREAQRRLLTEAARTVYSVKRFMFLSWQLMPRIVADRALTRSQALAIVENTPIGATPLTTVGQGIYLGLVAACAIVGFGLTIVLKRVAQPYAPPADDDID